MNQPACALALTPLAWIEAADLESLIYEKSTWIPLAASVPEFELGKKGFAGHRESYRSLESLVVPLSEREEFKDADWQTIMRHGGTDGVWADENDLYPPGCYNQTPRIIYPVILRSFDSGEPDEWVVQQEIEIGLQLLRKGDTWIRPRENDIEVVRLLRKPNGYPQELLIRAEHLRDYLCAKKAALLLTGFYLREAVEENFEGVTWGGDRQEKQFSSGERKSHHSSIHEGGTPFGMETAVMHTWRESVDPKNDVPEMPHPDQDKEVGMRSYSVKDRGKKLHMLYTRVWTKHWIEPAAISPRILRDDVESRVHFIVENQAQGTLAGKALEKYRGWLWFKPAVIRKLLKGQKGVCRWYTHDTGEIGPARDMTLHFGVNSKGLINVLGYKMANLPEWVQKIWVGENTTPEGGLSEELHMSQNLADPAKTMAPEFSLWHNLNLLQAETQRLFSHPLFLTLPTEHEFFRQVHRFYSDSFEDVCGLCKELHRIVTEPIDLGGLNAKIDPRNAEEANRQKLRHIKRVALWLEMTGHNGRKITQGLAGVADLRQGDAHMQGSKLRESLPLIGISTDATDYQLMALGAISSTGDSLAEIGRAITRPSQGGV